MFKKLAPSILDADFSCLERELKTMEDGGADLIHLDIMDGHFVPKISFGPDIVRSIKSKTSLPLSIHLMVENPERQLEPFIEAGGDIITVHYETCKHLDRVIQTITERGVKCGLALNPATPLNLLEYVINKIDLLLIMTVNPGYGGQRFIPEMFSKITKAKEMINASPKLIELEVDGGVNLDNLPLVIKAGADIVVVGQTIFKSSNPLETIIKIKNIIQENSKIN